MGNQNISDNLFWALFGFSSGKWQNKFQKETGEQPHYWTCDRLSIAPLYTNKDVISVPSGAFFSGDQAHVDKWQSIHLISASSKEEFLSKIQFSNFFETRIFLLDHTASVTYQHSWSDALNNISIIHLFEKNFSELRRLISQVNLHKNEHLAVRFEKNFKPQLSEICKAVQEFIHKLSPKSENKFFLAVQIPLYYKESECARIAWIFSLFTEIIHQLTEKGVTAEKIFNHVAIILPIGNSYFFEIAKLKSFRQLWNRFQQAYNVAIMNDVTLYAETTRFTNEKEKIHYNILSYALQHMVSVQGISNGLIIPENVSDAPEEQNDVLYNIKNVLLEESQLNAPDPGAGSYYIEHLTQQISEETWKIFLQYESQGGFHSLSDE